MISSKGSAEMSTKFPVSILMLIIFNNVFPQILQHDVHMLKYIIICRVEDFQSKTFQVCVPLRVIIFLVVMLSAINFYNKSKPFHEKVNNIVAYDLLSVKIKTVEHFLVYLLPKRNFGYVAGFSIFACIA